jgi:hypothetical protein
VETLGAWTHSKNDILSKLSCLVTKVNADEPL